MHKTFFREKIFEESIHHRTQDWSKLMVRIMDIHEERVLNISYDLLLLRIKKRVEAKHPGFWFGLIRCTHTFP